MDRLLLWVRRGPPWQEGVRWVAAALEEDFSLCAVSFVEFLLYRGKADLTVLDENKNTALHLACSKVLCRAGSACGG